MCFKFYFGMNILIYLSLDLFSVTIDVFDTITPISESLDNSKTAFHSASHRLSETEVCLFASSSKCNFNTIQQQVIIYCRCVRGHRKRGATRCKDGQVVQGESVISESFMYKS